MVGYLVFGYVDGYLVVYLIVKYCKVMCFEGELVCWFWIGWYIDVMVVVNLLWVLILCGVMILLYGGDMYWINFVCVYEMLFVLLCGFVDILCGIYCFMLLFGVCVIGVFDDVVECCLFVIEYLFVCVYLEIGECVLYVSLSFLKLIVGLMLCES